MVTYGNAQSDLTDAQIDRIFRALADATRRDIFGRTLTEEPSISELAHRYEMSFVGVRKHITVLEEAQLVCTHRSGRERRIRGNPEYLQKAQALLTAYERLWRERIDRLGALLAEDRR